MSDETIARRVALFLSGGEIPVEVPEEYLMASPNLLDHPLIYPVKVLVPPGELTHQTTVEIEYRRKLDGSMARYTYQVGVIAFAVREDRNDYYAEVWWKPIMNALRPYMEKGESDADTQHGG